MEEYINVPYVSIEEFNAKVDEYANTNWMLRVLFLNNKTWDDLPVHLKNDLFKRLGCKPDIKKY